MMTHYHHDLPAAAETRGESSLSKLPNSYCITYASQRCPQLALYRILQGWLIPLWATRSIDDDPLQGTTSKLTELNISNPTKSEV